MKSIIFILLLVIIFTSALVTSSLRSCSLADYIRVRGSQCNQGAAVRKIIYSLAPGVACRGPATIDLGEEQPCVVCELSDLSPFVGTADASSTCSWDGTEHNVNSYQAHPGARCNAPGQNLPLTSISGDDVPCVCTDADIRSSFTECVNGSRKLVYYYDHECDSTAFGAAQLPRASYAPCDIECPHGQYAQPLCTDCPVNTFSFSGHQYLPPYHDLPDDFVEQCYVYNSATSDGATPCPPDSTAGWRPCEDRSCITSGNAANLHSSDMQFVWHFNIVSLPATLSFEYRIESEEYFDWFGVETRTETLMWDSGNYPDWRPFEHNLTDIPFQDMCEWSIDNSVCIHPNNFAPFDPDSFWKPELTKKIDPSVEPFNYRRIILLPVKPEVACIEASYTQHPGLGGLSPTQGDITFLVEVNWNASDSSSSSPTPCSITTIADFVKKVQQAKGLILILLGRPSEDRALSGDSDTFPRGMYLGSISIPQGYIDHPAYAPTKDFLMQTFQMNGGAQTAHHQLLRWNRNPGHRMQITFFYTKDGATSIGRDRVELRNIRLEGTVKANENCELCPPGFSTGTRVGQHECIPCVENTFSAEPGDHCKLCPAGTISSRGSSSCIATRACTEDDYEAVLYGCHLNTQTNMYEQRISYRLSQSLGPSSYVLNREVCAPVPGFSIPDKIEPCNQCFYGEWFDMRQGTCQKCSPHQRVIFEPESARRTGCAACSTVPALQIPDSRIAFTDFLLFNGSLPSDIFSQRCFKCLGGDGNEAWEFNILGNNNNNKYENQVFFAQGGLGMTVLSVGENVLPYGTATLSLDFDQQLAGTVSFTYYTRIPLWLGNPFNPRSNPQIDFAHFVEVIVYDMTVLSQPEKIQQFNLAATVSMLHQKVSTQYFAPGPKRISFIYKNVLPTNSGAGPVPDPILFGLQSIAITGANPNQKYSGAEACRPCPFGYLCSQQALGVTLPCTPGYASAEGESDCMQCHDRVANGRVMSSVSPAFISEKCLDCSIGMYSNLARHSPGIPDRAFCSLEEAGFILVNRLVFFGQVLGDLITHGTTAQNLVRANPSDIQTQIAPVPDYNFARTYNDQSLVFDLNWLKSHILTFPSTNRRRLEVTLHAGLPDQVGCLTHYEKTTTNISFGCATNKANSESFSVGNMIEIEPIAPTEINYRTGIRIRLSGLSCRSDWGSGSFVRETIIQIACDPYSPTLENDLVTEAASSASVENTASCNLNVYAKWAKVCPVCNTKNMGFSYTSTCSSSSSSSSSSNVITKEYVYIDAFRRKATTGICVNGLYTPEPVKTPCPWIRDPIQPSNLEVIAIFLCVITLVTIIIYIIIYLIRNNKQINQKYQVLRQTYLASNHHHHHQDNNNNGEDGNNNGGDVVVDHNNTAINDDESPREMRPMSGTNTRGGRRTARQNSGNLARSTTSIAEINAVISTTAVVPTVTTISNNETDRDDVALNNLDQFNTVHEGVYSN